MKQREQTTIEVMIDHRGNNPLSTFTVGEWLDYGIARGWCSDTFCGIHDLGPLTVEEETALDDGDDPCILSVRLL